MDNVLHANRHVLMTKRLLLANHFAVILMFSRYSSMWSNSSKQRDLLSAHGGLTQLTLRTFHEKQFEQVL